MVWNPETLWPKTQFREKPDLKLFFSAHFMASRKTCQQLSNKKMIKRAVRCAKIRL
jgi:hypothetical protein